MVAFTGEDATAAEENREGEAPQGRTRHVGPGDTSTMWGKENELNGYDIILRKKCTQVTNLHENTLTHLLLQRLIAVSISTNLLKKSVNSG